MSHRLTSILGVAWLLSACNGDNPSSPETPPTADFTGKCASLACSFTDLSHGDHTLVAFDWSFGDGGTAVTRNPTHTYGSSGTYTVQLTITDNNGTRAHRSREVSVASAQAPDPAPTIALSPTSFFFCTPATGGSTRVCSGALSAELSVANSGSGVLKWTASTDKTWLSVLPAGGVTPSRHVTVSVSPAGLPPFAGAFRASITIYAAGASNSPRTVSVTVYQMRVR